MPHEAYPDSSDLGLLLTAGGVSLDSAIVENAVAAGIESFERDIGRVMMVPFSDEMEPAQIATTRRFTPPSNTNELDLIGDLLPDENDGITVEFTPLNSTPTTWTEGVDYWLLDEDAQDRNRPYTRLLVRQGFFYPFPPSYRRSIYVTGLWGYGLTIPDDAWLAMLYSSMLWLIDVGALAETGLVFRSGWKEAVDSETFSAAGINDRVASWRGLRESAVASYRRGL